MKNEFCTYEQALALKELGFNEPCLATYNGETLDLQLQIPSDDYFTSAPLKQQVFRWFREKQNLKGGVEYIGGIEPETTWWDIYVVGNYNVDYTKMEMKYQPYEEAESALIDKLIELAKLV